MAKIEPLVQDFLAEKKIAVVGVSNKRDTGCNSNYQKFKSAGYQVFAINPHITTFNGDPCYPNLKSLPEKPDAVFILAGPRTTDQIVQECVDLGIKHVWMHCMMGVKPGLAAGLSSVSDAAVALCRQNGIAVIPRLLPQSIPQARFWSWDDAQPLEHVRLHERAELIPVAVISSSA